MTELMRQIIVLFSLIVLSIFISACNNDSVGPQQSIQGGLTGTVMDTTGAFLDSVDIYCTYNFYFPYYGAAEKIIPFTPAQTDTIGFALYPSVPNPVWNSTYIKFSLPADSHIELSITGRYSSIPVYHYSTNYLAGL
ncbi:MAG: hypothetical protein ACM3RX_08940, partial [Methanococcaceae archaeon]